jgi:hypothetical protein
MSIYYCSFYKVELSLSWPAITSLESVSDWRWLKYARCCSKYLNIDMSDCSISRSDFEMGNLTSISFLTAEINPLKLMSKLRNLIIGQVDATDT